MTAPLPCPFCQHPNQYLAIDGLTKRRVYCWQCGSCGPERDSKDAAIAAWNAAPRNSWRSVADDPPPVRIPVLTAHEKSEFPPVVGGVDENGFWWEFDERLGFPVDAAGPAQDPTHWMPLPPAPEPPT